MHRRRVSVAQKGLVCTELPGIILLVPPRPIRVSLREIKDTRRVSSPPRTRRLKRLVSADPMTAANSPNPRLFARVSARGEAEEISPEAEPFLLLSHIIWGECWFLKKQSRNVNISHIRVFPFQGGKIKRVCLCLSFIAKAQ